MNDQDGTDAEASNSAEHSRSGRLHRALHGKPGNFVLYFKERIYATFTGLAIILVVDADEHADIPQAIAALLFGVVGITAAGFISDVISHLAVHRNLPSRRELLLFLRIAWGGLGTVVLPTVLLVLAGMEILPVNVGVDAALGVYVVTLAVIGWLAVRRSLLSWWQQGLALLTLVAFGVVVLALQGIAHSVGPHH